MLSVPPEVSVKMFKMQVMVPSFCRFFPTIPSGGEKLLIQFRVFWQMARGHSSWSICHWLSFSLCPGWDFRKSEFVLCNHAARGGNHSGTECCYMECCCHQKHVQQWPPDIMDILDQLNPKSTLQITNHFFCNHTGESGDDVFCPSKIGNPFPPK